MPTCRHDMGLAGRGGPGAVLRPFRAPAGDRIENGT
jgi:hypothetical protein